MKRLLILLMLATLLAACGSSAPATDDTAVQTAVAAMLTQQAPAPDNSGEAPAEETQPEATNQASIIPTQDTIPGLPAEATCVPLGTDRVTGVVTAVYTGDAAVVQIGDQKIEVRYIGIDAGDNAQATEANRALVEGKTVVLVRDVSDMDEYGRLLRYVMVDDAFVNLRLLQQRLVTVSIEQPDAACERLFNSIP